MSSFSCVQDDVIELYEMLVVMRPYGSEADKRFVKEFIHPLGVTYDDFGNAYKRIGDAPVIWSCHTDTVHTHGGIQAICRNDKYQIRLAKKSASNCLGADDTAGVWLMVQMIKAKVPGLFIFHRGEEKGGQGSRWIAEHNQDVTKGIKCVIALDRRNDNSVITFQLGQRCCSDEFGQSLADQLNKVREMKYSLDKGGSFTDSAMYVNLVGECTNLSVGYDNQHSSRESLDLLHLLKLREGLITVDVNALTYKRKPGEKESRWQNTGGGYNWGEYEGWGGGYYGGRNHPKSTSYKTPYGDAYYKEKYRGGYWDKMKWVQCTEEEWKKWVDSTNATATDTKKIEDKTNTKAAATEKNPAGLKVVSSTVSKGGPAPSAPLASINDVDKGVLDLVRFNQIAIARMLQDWGFDEASLREVVLEYWFKKGTTPQSMDNKLPTGAPKTAEPTTEK